MKVNGKFILTLSLLLATVTAFAQPQKFSGQVVDESGLPVIGASVIEKGTTNGSVTDFEGNFEVTVAPGKTLEVACLGYVSQEITARPNMHIVLAEDAMLLDDVIVIGYGVQKKSVVTASIAKVSSDDLQATAPVRMDNALKGLAAGVTVTSASGQPGAAAQIRVRGVGTINDSDPLYIVDGMPIEDGFDFVNPQDIESIEVLKDAASGAIYGARAANGVVLVTTKSGKSGKAKVSYNFYYGVQSKWKTRDVLNATEYAVMMNEGNVNAGGSPIYDDPYSYGEGTDWQEEVFNDNAPVMNHDISISGGNDKVSYYVSVGYFTQEGIVGGNYDRSNYQRLSLRSNTKMNLFDESKNRNWLNKADLTISLSYARVKSRSITVNSQYGSVLGSALALSPILTPTLTTAEEVAAQNATYSGNAYYTPLYDKNGNMYTIPGSEYNEMVNPLASLSLPGGDNWSHKFVVNFSGSLQLWDGFKFTSSYGADMSFWGSESYTTLYYLTTNNYSTHTSASQSSDRGTVWQIENTLTYDKTFGPHTVNVVLGQSAMENTGWTLSGSRNYLSDESKPYINFASGLAEDGDMSVAGGPSDPYTLSSLFARVSYNYNERYMLQATVRRDGSSRFGSNNKYATFPSVSIGWNLTNEPYLQDYIPDWVNLTKIRGSWGKNGNDNIGNFAYTVLSSSGYNYIFGSTESVTTGTKASGLANADLKWEESEQIDLGIDFGFLGSAVTFSVDYYRKTTDGMLMTMNIPSYVGESKPTGNVGSMRNSGVEFEAGYKFSISDFKFNIKGNASYLKNKLLEYGNEEGWANYDSFQSVGTITRAENGKPFPYFYGYKTAGIFQSIEEVNAYVNSDGELLQPDAKAGYVRFVDVNGDGTIDEDDRTYIGKGMPDWTFGLNFQMSWKGFDFSMMWQGVAGCEIFDATRRIDISSTNLPSWMLGRWTGPGTSDKYPIFIIGDSSDNWLSSDLYVYDGSYMRLKNIELGYTLPEKITRKVFVSSFRVYVAAENLLTLTKYHGYDPEISSGGTSLGVDYGVYPQARTLKVGCNLNF